MALFEQRDKLCEAADTGASTKPSIAAIDKELVALGYPKDQIWIWKRQPTEQGWRAPRS